MYAALIALNIFNMLLRNECDIFDTPYIYSDIYILNHKRTGKSLSVISPNIHSHTNTLSSLLLHLFVFFSLSLFLH